MPINDSEIVQLLTRLDSGKLLCIFKACLLSNLDAVKSAAMKGIEYLLEHQGCSLGPDLLSGVITALVATYPDEKDCHFYRKGLRVLESFSAGYHGVMPSLCQGLEGIDELLGTLIN